MDQYPKISIVIPCFNDLFIEQAVNSALGQAYPNKEIIIVDDGSNDSTIKLLRGLEVKVNKVIYQEHKGVSFARNTGIKEANGDYILPWDSDDFFEEDFCIKAFELLNNNYPDTRIVTCQARRFNKRGTIDIFKPRGGDLENFKFSNAAIGNSLFLKNDWLKVGGYDEKIGGYEDWELFIRILKLGGKAEVIQEPLFNYRQKSVSLRISHNEIKYDLWEYIFLKHKDIYLEEPDELVKQLISALSKEKREKKKLKENIEYRLGLFLLKPIRFLKSRSKRL